MGKVRTSLVKRNARDLLQKHPDLFTRDFEQNKRIVDKLLETRSKKLRNQIAGYITHLVGVLTKRTASKQEEQAPAE